jgi:hypothetical protein
MMSTTRQARVFACAEPVNMRNYAELEVMQSADQRASTPAAFYGQGSA